MHAQLKFYVAVEGGSDHHQLQPKELRELCEMKNVDLQATSLFDVVAFLRRQPSLRAEHPRFLSSMRFVSLLNGCNERGRELVVVDSTLLTRGGMDVLVGDLVVSSSSIASELVPETRISGEDNSTRSRVISFLVEEGPRPTEAESSEHILDMLWHVSFQQSAILKMLSRMAIDKREPARTEQASLNTNNEGQQPVAVLPTVSPEAVTTSPFIPPRPHPLSEFARGGGGRGGRGRGGPPPLSFFAPAPDGSRFITMDTQVHIKKLFAAATIGDVDTIRSLILETPPTLGFNRAAIGANVRNTYGRTPLHMAAEGGHTQMCRVLLLELGADATPRDNARATPLHLAVAKGHAETVRALLRHGADPNMKDTMGYTPLHYAVQKDKTALTTASRTSDGEEIASPLPSSAEERERRTREVVRVLVTEADTDVELVDHAGRPPIIIAAYEGNTAAIRELVACGADINQKGQYGSAYSCALGKGHTETARILKEEFGALVS